MEKKNAIITGATRGIGREVALSLAQKGCNVAFNYKSNDALAEELKKRIEEFGVSAFAMKVDISKKEEVKRFIDAYFAKFSTVDILINNAGIRRDKSLAIMSDSEWNDVVNTNLNGVFNITRPVVYQMVKQKCGHIINMSSVSGKSGIAGQTNYSATKAGIIGFTKALAKEVAGYNIRVNAVAPGFIESDMTADFKERFKDNVLKTIPLKRFGTIKEVSNLIEYLLSGGDDYMIGQVFYIDGGLSI